MIDQIGDLSPDQSIWINDNRYFISRLHNSKNLQQLDQIEKYIEDPNPSAINLEKLTLDSPRLARVLSKAIADAQLLLWIQPNEIKRLKIASVEGSLINYIAQKPFRLNKNKPIKYSIANHIAATDRAGEFTIDHQSNKIFFIPYPECHCKGNVKVSTPTRSVGIDLNGQSHIIIRNLTFMGHGSSGESRPISGMKPTSTNIKIRNVEIENSETIFRNAAIEIRNAFNLELSEITIRDCIGCSGISVSNSQNITIKSNKIENIGRTGIRLIGTSNSTVSHNVVNRINSLHGNGISFYRSNKNIVLRDNLVSNAERSFTFHGHKNQTDTQNWLIYNNIFTGNTFSWNRPTQNIAFIKNTMLFQKTPRKGKGIFQIGEKDNNVIVAGNIIDGAIIKSESVKRRSNIYTRLSWQQSAKYGWYLGEHEYTYPASLESALNGLSCPGQQAISTTLPTIQRSHGSLEI